MKIATVPIGYADGLIRQNAKDGYMTVNGKKAKIVGRICTVSYTHLDVYKRQQQYFYKRCKYHGQR